jgi:chorismate mutase
MNLDKLRLQIDQLDRKILSLLNKRLRLAPLIAQRKKHLGEAIFAPDREAALLRRLFQSNSGPSHEKDLRAIYREIFSSSRARQGGLQIAVPAGDLASWGIARSIFGSQEHYLPITTLSKSFRQLSRSQIDLITIPLQNWLSDPDFKKNGALLKSAVDIFLQIPTPSEILTSDHSPFPPYWILRKKNPSLLQTTFTSGWLFFQASSPQAARKKLQKAIQQKGWEPWVHRTVEYSNRQTWRCGVEWRRVLSASDYKTWKNEFRKLPGFQFDALVNSEYRK